MLIELDQLSSVRSDFQDKQIVIRAGCYDLLHEGHTKGLRFAKSLGDILVVGVWPDIRVRQRKGINRPIRNELSRALLISELAVVDYSLIMPTDDKEDTSMIKVIKKLHPDVFVVADAQRGHPNDYAIENEYGVRIVSDMNEAICSTTEIIDIVRNRYSYEQA